MRVELLRDRAARPVAVAVPRPGSGSVDQASWLAKRPRGALIATAGLFFAFVLGYMAMRSPRDAIAIFGGAAIVLFVLMRPRLGALAMVAFVPTLSGLVPGVPVPNVRVSEALIGVIGMTLLVTARRNEAVPWSALDWLLLAYGLLWTIDGVWGALTAHQHLSISAWGTVAGQLQFFLLYRSLKVTLRSPDDRHTALRVLFVASGVVALLAVFQEIKVPGVVSLIATLTGSAAAGGSNGVIRATGPFANWAALAGYMLPLVFIALCLGLGSAIPQHKRFQFGLGMLLALALFVTAEFSVILCLIAGVCVLGMHYGRGRMVFRWLGVSAVVIVVVAGGLLFQRLDAQLSTTAGSNRHAGVPQTLNTRWTIWTQQYIPAIEQKPITGYGVELPSSIRWQFPESQYIAFLIEGGVPLLALFAFLAWAMYADARRAGRSDDPIDHALGQGLRVSVLAMVVVDVVWPFLSNGGMPQLLWCLFALLPTSVSGASPGSGRPETIRIVSVP